MCDIQSVFSALQPADQVRVCTGLQTRGTGRPKGITDRKIIFELFMHFVADTDTDENHCGTNIS